jgi:hypothetical protein
MLIDDDGYLMCGFSYGLVTPVVHAALAKLMATGSAS